MTLAPGCKADHEGPRKKECHVQRPRGCSASLEIAVGKQGRVRRERGVSRSVRLRAPCAPTEKAGDGNRGLLGSLPAS